MCVCVLVYFILPVQYYVFACNTRTSPDAGSEGLLRSALDVARFLAECCGTLHVRRVALAAKSVYSHTQTHTHTRRQTEIYD